MSSSETASINKGSSTQLSVQTTVQEKISSVRSHVIHEWIVIMVLLMGAIVYEVKLFPVRHQQIPGYDPQAVPAEYPSYLNYNNDKKPQISIAALVLCSGLPPILTILINGIILKFFGKQCNFATFMHHFHLMLRSGCLSFTGTWFASNIMKYSIGRPRPVFVALQQASRNLGLEDNVESRLSFPSVHASVSFALLFQLSLHLYMVHSHVTRTYNKFNTPNYDPWNSDNPYSHYFHWLFYKLRSVPLISLFVVGIPTYFATYIACTRIVDFQHFYSDVLGGTMIGVFFAVASYSHYSIYFHAPKSSAKHSIDCQTQTFGELHVVPSLNLSPTSKEEVSIQIDE